MKSIWIFVILTTASAWADNVLDPGQSADTRTGSVEATSRSMRSRNPWSVAGVFSPVDLWIPLKFGAHLAYTPDSSATYELEYLRGSVTFPFFVEDLGKLTDSRLSLVVRSFGDRNSFYVSYGVSYVHSAVEFGPDVLARVPGSPPTTVSLLEVNSLGAVLGIGNRWRLGENVGIGLDWIELTQPLLDLKRESAFLDYATDAGDREHVDTMLKIFSHLPRLVLFKVSLGIHF